jgi:hypothetical protein
MGFFVYFISRGILCEIKCVLGVNQFCGSGIQAITQCQEFDSSELCNNSIETNETEQFVFIRKV